VPHEHFPTHHVPLSLLKSSNHVAVVSVITGRAQQEEARPEWDGATFVMTLQGVETRRSVHGDTLTMSMIARSPRRRGVATRVFARI